MEPGVPELRIPSLLTAEPLNLLLQVEVVSDDDVSQVDEVMQHGQVFAHREMLTQSTHLTTTRARDHVELLALTLTDLKDVLRAFPEVYQGVYQYALNQYNYSIYV